jgi:hypothetical protein
MNKYIIEKMDKTNIQLNNLKPKNAKKRDASDTQSNSFNNKKALDKDKKSSDIPYIGVVN